MGSEGFLMSGVTIAFLKVKGKMPSAKDMLMIEVIGVMSTSRHAFTSVVGQGSRSHCLFGEAVNNFRTSASVTLINFVNCTGT